MALEFNTQYQASIKGRVSIGGSKTISGVTSGATTPENAAAQISKILGILEVGMVADDTMTRTLKQEAEENGE